MPTRLVSLLFKSHVTSLAQKVRHCPAQCVILLTYPFPSPPLYSHSEDSTSIYSSVLKIFEETSYISYIALHAYFILYVIIALWKMELITLERLGLLL